LKRIGRRKFLKLSALWATAAALNSKAETVHASGAWGGQNEKVIVIGSGLGGLACAAYLCKHGYRTLVLEQHDQPGGYATRFSRQGGRFNFEVSLHQTAIGGVTELILRDLGVLDRVRFEKGRELFRVIGKGLDMRCPGSDPSGFERMLVDYFPAEREGIKGFVEEMIGLNEEVESFFGKGSLSLSGKIAFPFQYPRMWGARNKSLSYYLDRYVSNPRLRSILSVFCGYYGLPPSKISGFYYLNATGGFLRYGGSYPHGGSEAITGALVNLIEQNQGEVRLGTSVTGIAVDRNVATGVITASGGVKKARAVVANCSAREVFGKLIPSHSIPSDFRKRIDSLKPSISSFIVWLGLKQDITQYIPDAHIFVVEEYDPEKAFQNWVDCRVEKVNYSVVVYDNIYKGYSPKGCSTVCVMFPCGYEPWKAYEEDYLANKRQAYHAEKRRVADILMRRAETAIMPGVSSMIAVTEAATPLTNIRYTLNSNGAIYGFEQIPDNAFMNRISNETPIKGLYLASAWGDPGGGYSGVLISGRKTFGMLMNDWNR